jgi:type II secretory pathway component GspD/PulD (secretin)
MVLLLALGIGLGAVSAQEKTADKGKRIAYVVQHGTAKDFAAMLRKHFKDDVEVQVLPGTTSNCLLINAPGAVFDEVIKLLAQIDRPPRNIEVDVLIAGVSPKKGDDKPDAAKEVDLAEFSGPASEVMQKARGMLQKGPFTRLRQLHFTLVEGQPSSSLLGETKPYVTAMSTLPNGRVSRTYTLRQLGTQVRLTARVAADKKIEIDFELSEARAQPDESRTLGKDENGNTVKGTDFILTKHSAKLRVGSGQAVAAQGVKTQSNSGKEQVVIIVTAKVVDPDAKGEKEGTEEKRPTRPKRP